MTRDPRYQIKREEEKEDAFCLEWFDYSKWKEAFEESQIDTAFYANRKREYNEILPWDHLDYLVSKNFLINENKKSHENITTKNCRLNCSNCGVSKEIGGACFE